MVYKKKDENNVDREETNSEMLRMTNPQRRVVVKTIKNSHLLFLGHAT